MCAIVHSFRINGVKMSGDNPKPPHSPESDFSKQWPSELSQYLNFDDDQWSYDDLDSFVSGHAFSHKTEAIEVDDGDEHEKNEVKDRVAFKTKSEIEIMDDGFKWRKYGKKMVKNSPNPRNYYRCSVEGCSVKKVVERDKDDPRYVITTYVGTHTHPSYS
ncbi:probable WRKY transcription factor 50 isoform X2 [Vigna unguiculata]|uniref:probable WRKY transcription factor 50 isoform X2 n=1 Tax=Vigna unguiculata TaxID=3917 RepID=UPI001015D292|nr:probable WRKY transcription factor 50 isoform X2 [Vigna unguiculata]